MSTVASVSSVELKLRNEEMGPRATAAVSTGTASAAAWRALSFSACAAFCAAAGSAAAALAAPAAGAAEVEAGAAVVAAVVAGTAASRLQADAQSPAAKTISSAVGWPTERDEAG